MYCPRCGAEMTQGAPHADGDAYQYEWPYEAAPHQWRPSGSDQADYARRPYDCDHS